VLSKVLRHKKFALLRRKETVDYIKEHQYVIWRQLETNLGMKKGRLKRLLKHDDLCVSLNSKRQFFTLRSLVFKNRESHDSILWRIDGKVFSLVGGLRETALELIRKAPDGIDEKTLSERLGTPARNVLTELKAAGKVRAVPFQGRQVYFHKTSKRYHKQLRRRLRDEECEELQISFEEFLRTLDPEIRTIARELVPKEIQEQEHLNPKEIVKLLLVQPKVAQTSDRHMARVLRNDSRMKK